MGAWLAWARGLSIPEERLAGAVAVAQALAATDAPSPVVLAGALAAGGTSTAWVDATLAEEARRNDILQYELTSVRPRGALTAAAVAEHRAIVGARRDAVGRAMRRVPVPTQAGGARPHSDTGPRSVASEAAAPAGGPAGSGGSWLRAFVEDHSILLLSYVGAFLMVVAAVVYELYGLNQLSGPARFAGILVLTLFFGVTADVCLFSARMRVVGRTYLAIFDALLPLLAFAAWAFLGLGARQVTIAEAQLVTGLALVSLYGALALQVRSPWQAALALAAVPVVLLGIAGLTPALDQWRWPIVTVAPVLYAVVAVVSARRTRVGPPLPLLAVVLTHLGVAFSLGVAIEAALSTVGAAPWSGAAGFGLIAIAYALLAMRRNEVVAPTFASVASLAAWLFGAGALDVGVWTGPAITPLVIGLAVVALLSRRARAGPRLRRFAVPAIVVAAVAVSIAMSLGLLNQGATKQAWLAMAAGAAVAGATATGLRLAHFRLGAPLWPSTLVAAALGSVSVLALVPGLGGGSTAVAATLVGLAAVWWAGTAAQAAPGLRIALRIGTVALAAGALLVFDAPPPVAAGVAFFATAVVVANATNSGKPLWLAPATATLPALVYWLARSLTGTGPASAELTWALLPAPAAVGVIALLLRRGRTAPWGHPVYWAAAAVGLLALCEGLAAQALEPVGLTLVVEAATLYAIALRERLWPLLAAAFSVLGAGILITLVAVQADTNWYGASFAAAGLAIYAAGMTETQRLRLPPAWHPVHRAAGIGGVAVPAALGLLFWEATAPHSNGALLGMLASLLLGGLVLLDGYRHRLRLLVRVSPVLASLACFFLARYLGAGNAQWYVAGPGLALLACGLGTAGRGPFPHPTSDQVAGQVLLAGGLALLLGTTAAQSVWLPVVWAPTTGLAIEGALAIVGGIPTRSRVLIIGGSAGIAVAGIRALFVLAQSGLLFAGLAGIAFVLLASAATLALLRNRRGAAQ